MVQAGGVNSGGGGREGERFALNSPLDTNPFAMAPHDIIEAAAKEICEDLIDDAILNITFEVHRSMKRGLLTLETGLPEDEGLFYQVNAEGVDVFGQAPVKKQHECVCPNCSRNLAASRFAPHLEKCLGMGRNSSRIASRRIQNCTREASSHLIGGGQGSDDDEDDDDWFVDRKRRKREKNSPRRNRNNKGNLQICGVVSEHTGKMCTRSIRCPQHSMEQRRAVRDQVIGGFGVTGSTHPTRNSQSNANVNLASKYSIVDNDDHLQVGDTASLETESVWEHDLSNTTSPADSTSTNNSSSTATTSSSSSSSSSNKKSSSSGKSKKKNNKRKENHSNVIIE